MQGVDKLAAEICLWGRQPVGLEKKQPNMKMNGGKFMIHFIKALRGLEWVKMSGL